MLYVGLAIADSMFPASCRVSRVELDPDAARFLIQDWAPDVAICANPSHAATFAALRERFNIDLPIPATAPCVRLAVEDMLLVLQVGGLPRLDATRHEYTHSEIAGATWRFGLWEVLA